MRLKYIEMRRMPVFATIVFLLAAACNDQPNKSNIYTVNGSIPASQIGTSLIHEHIMVDFIGADSTGPHRWDRQQVIDRALPYLEAAKAQGVQTLFECTPAYLGRDPHILKALAEKTGMHIITNTGYYGAVNNKFLPPVVYEAPAEEIADSWIDEFQNGIEDTGVKPGFIKIAVARDDTLSPVHQKIVRAAAITHKSTGLTIVSHTGPNGPAFAQLALLQSEGVSPEAFVWTHAQGGTLEGHIKAARMGAWVSLDNVRDRPSKNPEKPGRIEWFAERLSTLKSEGLLDNVLISHDSGWYRVGQENGGTFNGYTAIFTHLIPALKEHGFTEEDINLLLVKNPMNAYAVRVRTNK